jgi:hypothetical protein
MGLFIKGFPLRRMLNDISNLKPRDLELIAPDPFPAKRILNSVASSGADNSRKQTKVRHRLLADGQSTHPPSIQLDTLFSHLLGLL